MKRRFTYLGAVVLSALLCLILLCCAVLPVAAGTQAEALPSLDYGIAGRDNNTALSATELYERLFASEPTAAEALYLQTTGIMLQYNALVPDNRIVTSYNGDVGVLTVEIMPYTYTAANGEKVTWVPTSATIDGVALTISESNGIYTCSMGDLFFSEDFDIQVVYTWVIEIPAAVVRELRTAAFEAGSDALAEQAVYEAVRAVYDENLNAHNDWLLYNTWLDEHDAWEREYALYGTAKQAYDDYCEAYARYEQEQTLYDQWQAYYDYIDFVTNRLEDYNKYKTYLAQLQPVTDMLALMESLFIADSHGWQMYASIMGDTVDQVLDNEDLLVNTGNANEADIRLAGEATKALRKLLPPYAALRNATYATEHDRIAALYGYYTQNYDALAKHFQDLYKTLNAMFQNTVVKLYIMEQGKFDHYLQFVGQLYVIATCLDQSGDRNPNWTISDKKLSAVVEPIHLLPDGNWDPSTKQMPAYVEPVDYVAPSEPPTEAQPAAKPMPPTPVANPGPAPTEPLNPFGNTVPLYAPHPGDAPNEPTFDAVTTALMQEIESGVLTRYEGTSEAMTLSFDTVTERLVSIRNLKTVSFYDLNGNLLHRVSVDYGTSANFTVPELEPTAQYTFVPTGWISVDGSHVNLINITDNLSLIPAYTKILRYYDVTWYLGDDMEVTSWPYGSTPKPPAKWLITDYEHGNYSYTFSGWDHEIGPVTGDATYRGEMHCALRSYTVTWILYGDRTIVEQWPALSTPTFSGDTERPPDSCVYTFRGWTGPIGAISGDVTYRAYYESTRLAVGGTNEPMDVEHGTDALCVKATQSSLDVANAARYALEVGKELTIEWENGVTLRFQTTQLEAFVTSECRRIIMQAAVDGDSVRYEIRFCDAIWNTLETVGEGATLTLPQVRESDRETVFFLEESNGATRLDGATVFLRGSAVIRRVYAHKLFVTANSLFDISALTAMAAPGEEVSLAIRCRWGYEVIGAIVWLADGTAVEVRDDLTFVMPNESVSVTLEIAEIQYVVTFLVNGTVWSSATYKLGEEIVLPNDPTLPAKDGYGYTFIGWGEVPAIASGDVRTLTFQASFAKAKQNVDYSTGHNNNLFMELYLPLFLTFIVVVVGGLILWRSLRKRARRRRMATAESALSEMPVLAEWQKIDGNADSDTQRPKNE